MVDVDPDDVARLYERQEQPGSAVARQRGCTCPVADNHHGRGRYGDGARFGWYVRDRCPVHSDHS